jgi:DNA-binding MarR family transcriptional regulator
MHKTKVSRAVRALEERRWLKRRPSEEDRREEILMLTTLGQKAYREIVPKALAFERRLLDQLGPEAEPLMEALEHLEIIVKVAARDGDDET